LKDLNDAVQVDPKTKIMRLLATPQAVEFGGPDKAGDSLISKEPLQRATNFDVESVNPMEAEALKDHHVYEVVDEEKTDSRLNGALNAKRPAIEAAVKQDQKDIQNPVNQSSPARKITSTTSAEALRTLWMDW